MGNNKKRINIFSLINSLETYFKPITLKAAFPKAAGETLVMRFERAEELEMQAKEMRRNAINDFSISVSNQYTEKEVEDIHKKLIERL